MARDKQYCVEFKIGDSWVKTETLKRELDALGIEKALHDAGMKARILVISSEFLG